MLHDLQGFRRTIDGWRIVSVKGWLRPSPSDEPGTDLPYLIISASDSAVPSVEIQIPPGPFGATQNYGIQIVYESNGYFDETDEKGREVFRFPRHPENLAYLLPKGYAVVGADFLMVIEEKDGRVQVMKENLTDETLRDSRGNEMTVRTRKIAG